MLPVPGEHLGLGKWLHSALFRREKRILWLQTTLSVNILQLCARLSDDKPHAARRAANLRPYGFHFIVIFHGRNVDGGRLPQPSLTAPLSTLETGRSGPRCPLPAPTLAARSCGQALRPPGPGPQLSGWAQRGTRKQPPLLSILFIFSEIRNAAASPGIGGGKQGGQGPGRLRRPPLAWPPRQPFLGGQGSGPGRATCPCSTR